MTLSVLEKKRLKTKYGPWAVVTGASSGIGLEIAERLAESGLNLVINSRNLETLEKISTDLKSKYAVEVLVVATDISQQKGIDILIQATKNLNVGMLVASAGFGTSGTFHVSPITDEVNMLRVNCEALMILTHHFSNIFVQNRRGGIILMSSIVAFQGVPYAAHYAATKAYVQTLAEGIALELRPFGVDVLAAAPGPVASGFGQRANMNMTSTLTPQQVGIPILKALGRTTTVLPGFLTKLLAYSLSIVPRWGKIRIMKTVMSGMTEHQKR